MYASDIKTFFITSTRNKNDLINKIRENILNVISNPPTEFIDNVEFGTYWNIVQKAWNDALTKIAIDTNIPSYTSTESKRKGGRRFHYDMDIRYYNEKMCIAHRKIEFKNGGITINDIPQFLSLQTKFGLFNKTYEEFWYENYIDRYVACDNLITEAKPPLHSYLKIVSSTNYNIHPFFAQLKNREEFCKTEKNEIVNESITDYLTRYGTTIDIESFTEKVKQTQRDKIYLLWYNGTFHLDKFADEEMKNITFNSIKNGNILELKTGTTTYSLLLRWRNHKGILNPAWQISMKREQSKN